MFDMTKKITEFNLHHSQFDVFDKVVQPVVPYGCEICGIKKRRNNTLKTILRSTFLGKTDVVKCLSVF